MNVTTVLGFLHFILTTDYSDPSGIHLIIVSLSARVNRVQYQLRLI